MITECTPRPPSWILPVTLGYSAVVSGPTGSQSCYEVFACSSVAGLVCNCISHVVQHPPVERGPTVGVWRGPSIYCDALHLYFEITPS